jgi:hypothetical protein
LTPAHQPSYAHFIPRSRAARLARNPDTRHARTQ